MHYKPTKFLIFFLCKLPLTLRVDRKQKRAGNIYNGTPDIEFEQDWSAGLGATLRETEN